jgi:hypothetical protein
MRDLRMAKMRMTNHKSHPKIPTRRYILAPCMKCKTTSLVKALPDHLCSACAREEEWAALSRVVWLELNPESHLYKGN